MVHQRIRKYNTKDVYPEQNLDNDLCMAVRAGNRIWLRGQTGLDFDHAFHSVGDPVAQTDVAMANVKAPLDDAGAKLEHIVKTTIYLTDPRYRDPVYRTIGKWLKGVHPCSTGLIVQALAKPEMVMEIDVEAVIPEDEA